MKVTNANPDPGKEPVVMWVITREGEHFILCRHVDYHRGLVCTGHRTLEEARQVLAKYDLTLVPRMEGDDPCIVEVWL